MAAYYTFWEQAVFNALALMALHSLEALHKTFSGGSALLKVRRCWQLLGRT